MTNGARVFDAPAMMRDTLTAEVVVSGEDVTGVTDGESRVSGVAGGAGDARFRRLGESRTLDLTQRTPQ